MHILLALSELPELFINSFPSNQARGLRCSHRVLSPIRLSAMSMKAIETEKAARLLNVIMLSEKHNTGNTFSDMAVKSVCSNGDGEQVCSHIEK